MRRPPPGFSELLALSTPENRISLDPFPDVADFRVYEGGGCRWLCDAADAVQTAILLEDPGYPLLVNHRAMLLAELCGEGTGRVLDLGSGGGGFCRYFHARRQVPRIDAVELSPAIIEIARRYFLFPGDQAVIRASAEAFIDRTSNRYDLIFCDLFSGRRAPAALSNPRFHACLARCLSPQGTLALNTLPSSAAELENVLRAARAAFTGIGLLQFDELGNIVLLLRREALSRDRLIDGLGDGAFGDDPALRRSVGKMTVI